MSEPTGLAGPLRSPASAGCGTSLGSVATIITTTVATIAAAGPPLERVVTELEPPPEVEPACELVRVVTGPLDGAELPLEPCDALVRVVTGAPDRAEPAAGAEAALVRVVTAARCGSPRRRHAVASRLRPVRTGLAEP